MHPALGIIRDLVLGPPPASPQNPRPTAGTAPQGPAPMPPNDPMSRAVRGATAGTPPGSGAIPDPYMVGRARVQNYQPPPPDPRTPLDRFVENASQSPDPIPQTDRLRTLVNSSMPPQSPGYRSTAQINRMGVGDRDRDEVMAEMRSKHSPEEISRAGVPPHVQRQQWLETMTRRYRRDIAAGTLTVEQLLQHYDSGVKDMQAKIASGQVSSDPYANQAHRAGAMAGLALTGPLKAAREAQIWLNVDKRADQTNLAREMGVSRGHVIAMQDIQSSLASGDRAGAAAKMAMYGISPDAVQGMLGLAAAESQANAQMAAIKAKEPKSVPESYQENVGVSMGMPPGQRLGSLRVSVAAMLGKDAKPEMVEAQVRSHYQGTAAKIAAGGFQMSPEERMEMQEVTGSMNYSDWLRYLNVTDSPQNRQVYTGMTGRNAAYTPVQSSSGHTDFFSNAIDWLVPDALWDNFFGGK